MDESAILLDAIQAELDDFLDARRLEFQSISPDLAPIIDFSKELLRGGKRFRALFCYWAWVGSLRDPADASDEVALASIIKICASLELFHAAALVHDDVIDQSNTRRGKPAMHKRFEAMHTEANWAGLSQRFGESAAIIVGDLLLSWSSELFGTALLETTSHDAEAACRNEFGRMRIEVMAGQYLDVLEENAGPTRELSEAVARANRVMLYKTAKYSIEAPLLIGAAFAGAGVGARHALSSFAIPLGLAFQLRDDILGVFGDPSVTGKPAGDDLREGKRTVLVGLTREVLEGSVASLFDRMISDSNISEDQIKVLQQTIVGSGALKKTESMIAELGSESLMALEQIALNPEAKRNLGLLADLVMNREN